VHEVWRYLAVVGGSLLVLVAAAVFAACYRYAQISQEFRDRGPEE
jgi:hypothetical protein